MDIILLYKQNSSWYSETFDCLVLKGMYEPDKLQRVSVTHDCLDGSVVEQIRGFNKVITATFRATATASQRRFLARWFVSERKTIAYGNYVSSVIVDQDLVDEWLYECEHNRQFTVTMLDTHLFTAWDDGISGEDLMYCKLEIEMDDTKTEADPELFETNVGKLQYMETGATDPFPLFDDSLYVFYVSMLASKGSAATFPIADIAIVAGNLTFKTFPASGFIPASDGKLYANFAVWLQAKP